MNIQYFKITTWGKPTTLISKFKRQQWNHKQSTKNWTLVKKQTILTGDQLTIHISNGSRVSRHSLLTILYLLFIQPHIFLIPKFNFMLNLRRHIGFCPTTQANPSGKRQRPVSAAELFKNDVSYLYCQVHPDYFTINNHYLTNWYD